MWARDGRLTCAYFLARLGYKPVIFEAEARPGGMLVQAIPAYRLPRETLAREIRMIESLGVEIQTLRRLGRDFTLPDLRQEGYEAVFLAVGASEGLNLAIPGHEAKGVVDRSTSCGSTTSAARCRWQKCGGDWRGNAAIDARGLRCASARKGDCRLSAYARTNAGICRETRRRNRKASSCARLSPGRVCGARWPSAGWSVAR